MLNNKFSVIKYINLIIEGRGYKIRKKKNFYNFFFNKSHLLYLYSKNIQINKINKRKFFFKTKPTILNKLLKIRND